MKDKDCKADSTEQDNTPQKGLRKKLLDTIFRKDDPIFVFLTGFVFLTTCLVIMLIASIGISSFLFVISTENNPRTGVAAVPLPEWATEVHEEFLAEVRQD